MKNGARCIEKEGTDHACSSNAIRYSGDLVVLAKFDSMVHLRPIHNEAGYDQMTSLMNSLLDVVGDNENHTLSGLLELVGDLVSKYEGEHYAIDPAEPKDSLRFLMEARGLKQDDLCAIVPQSNLSAILVGKRKISATLAGKFGKFFGVSPAIFVPR